MYTFVSTFYAIILLPSALADASYSKNCKDIPPPNAGKEYERVVKHTWQLVKVHNEVFCFERVNLPVGTLCGTEQIQVNTATYFNSGVGKQLAYVGFDAYDGRDQYLGSYGEENKPGYANTSPEGQHLVASYLKACVKVHNPPVFVTLRVINWYPPPKSE